MQRLTLFALFLAATPALAQVTPEQIEFAEKSILSWNAFQCSVLAAKKGDRAEQERLFHLGYREGLTFYFALEAGKLPEEALRKHTALQFRVRLTGATPEFRLGRIFERALEVVYDDVLTDTDDEVTRMQAEKEFSRRNCSLLR